jgi:serine protease Do
MICALVLATPMASMAISAENATLTPRTFADLAKKVRPAVVSVKVNVETLKRMEKMEREPRFRQRTPKPDQEQQLPEGIPDWLKDFLKEMPEGQQGLPRGMDRDMFRNPYGAGTGFIVSPDGYIVTNRHVVYSPMMGMFGGQPAEPKITVVLSDKREFKNVKIVATDQLSDVAVLKIDAQGLPTVAWGDSDKLEVGEIVMAVGDPLELAGSVSEGIVSGIARDVDIAGYPQLLQTTAVINPGNSGGPLLNLDGEVVGINMAIASTTRLWSGVGFAIPSSLARKVADDLISKGHPIRGYIGIQMTDPDEFRAFAEHEGYKEESGVGIVEVYPDLPAAKAGLKPYDIIVEIGGEKIDGNVALQRVVTRLKPGDKINFKVYRGGQTRNLSVTVGEWPTEKELATLSGTGREKKAQRATEEQPEVTERGRLGLVVENLSESPKGARAGVQHGVVIRQIQPDSPATKAQPELQVGDIILEAEKQPVDNAEAFSQVVQEHIKQKDDTLLLKIRRGERTALVLVPLQ